MSSSYLVVPLAGTWIETFVSSTPFHSSTSSFPSRERGLKRPVLSVYWTDTGSFPSRERGLKLCDLRLSVRVLRSFPSRERGLKLSIPVHPIAVGVVVPLAGTWIETCCATDQRISTRSFPSRERGLKQQFRVAVHVLGESFPSRERGLKLHSELRKYTSYYVVPLAGTWIETSYGVNRIYKRSIVVPLAGTWIETLHSLDL